MIFMEAYWPWILGIFLSAALLWLAAEDPKPKGSSRADPLDKDWLANLRKKEEDKK